MYKEVLMSFSNWLETHITLHESDNRQEEKANAITHLIGAILSLGACIWVLTRISSLSKPSMAAGAMVFVLSMFLLYSASSLYHYLPKGNAKRLCRVFDHANIYILIAGTYTPMLLYVNSSIANTILLLVWGITIVGIIFTLVFWGRFGIIHVMIYLLMGWMIVLFWGDIIPYLPSGLLTWILAGGMFYTVGVVFYAMKRLPYSHAIWHMFVLGGTACHFLGFVIHLL